MGSNKKEEGGSGFELSATKELKQRKNPFLRPIFAVAAIGGLFMILGNILQMAADEDNSSSPQTAMEKPEATHLTINGECVCIKCTLKISTQHHRAIRYRGENSQTRVILLEDNPAADMDTNYFCNGPTPCLAEGDIIDHDGLRMLKASVFKAFPAEKQ